MRRCTIEDCSNKHLAIGLCRTHYFRMYRYGDLDGGPRNQPTKLTAPQIREIRALRNGGMTLATIAAQIGVCITTIHNIMNGDTWHEPLSLPLFPNTVPRSARAGTHSFLHSFNLQS